MQSDGLAERIMRCNMRQGPVDDGDRFEIDTNRLDWEWQRQPRLTHDALMRVAEARRALAEAERMLKVAEAEIRGYVRQSPESFGLPAKPTVDDFTAAVHKTKEWQQAKRKVEEAAFAVDAHNAEAKALSDKRAALENHVILHCRNYSAQPEVPRGYADQHRQQAERYVRDAEDDAINSRIRCDDD